VDIDAAPARLRRLPSWLLNQSALAAQRLVADGLGAVGAHRSHYAVLAALDEFGADSQAALGRRSGIDRSDMVALVDRLADDGLVDRRPDPADRRRNVVTLAPAGRRRLRGIDAAVGRVQDDLLAPLSSRERDQLVALLTRVVEHNARS
jgi:DNA-binding MarR family transcriptional regulator